MLTKEELKQGLRDIGVRPGMTLEVHCSLSSFGYVYGGADTVIDALKETVTGDGSIFMPSLRLSLPLELSARDKELNILSKIRILPADCEKSAMGAVSDVFRRLPDTCTGEGVFRISGWGKNGREAAAGGLDFALKQGGKALLLGVDIYKLTAMHYVEELLPADIGAIFAPDDAVNTLYPPDKWLVETGRPPVMAWYTIQQIAYQRGLITDGLIGSCKVMFFDLREVVGIYESALKSDPYGLYGLKG